MTISANELSDGVDVAHTPTEMQRVITWRHAFWITAGASPWVLFSIGAMADTLGTASVLAWAIASVIGLVQLFLYAELAGIFPRKTGGGSVYGSVAWVKYGKIFAPINMGAYWFGTSTSLAVLASLCGSYIVSAYFSNTAFATFNVVLLDLSSILPGITFQLNGTIVTGIAVLLVVFAIQHTGILRAAKIQRVIALLSVVPLVLLAIVPIVNGTIDYSNLTPFELKGGVDWTSAEGLTLIAGGLLIAAWSAYGAEQAVTFVSEFKNPSRDSVLAILSTGVVAFVCYVVLPFTFLGVLGLATLTQPDFVAGYTQKAVEELATRSFGSYVAPIVTIVLILALLLSVGTLLAVSARTLYQSAVDGVFPKFLSRLNKHRAPVAGMWADVVVNAVLMLLGHPLFVLAAGAVCYVLSVSMDIVAVRMLRQQYPDRKRHYRAPDWLVNYGAPVLAAFNVAVIIFGANVFVPNALFYGLGVIGIILLLFLYRHYIVDKGEWPEQAKKDLGIE